jgi:MFS family permease
MRKVRSAPNLDAQGVQYPIAFRANLTLGLLFVAYIFSFLDRQILSLMVGPVRASLHITDFQMSLLQGIAFSLFFVMAGVIIGRMADRYRRTWIIAAGIFLWCLMTAASGFAPSFLLLFIARTGLGVGEAALAPAGFSLLSDSFRPDRLVRATSIFSLGSLLGGGMAYFIGGALIEWLSQTPRPFQIFDLEPWQMAFICASIPGLLVVPALLMLPEPPRLGLTDEPKQTLREALAYLWLRRHIYTPFFACSALLGISNYGGLAWFPTYIMRNFTMGPLEAGSILGIIQLTGSIAGAVIGAGMTEYFQACGRSDAHLLTVFVMSVGIAAGLCACFMPNVPTTLILWTLAIVCLSAYFGSIMAALQLMTPNSIRASTSAILLMISSLCGLGLGTALIGAVADLFFADRPYGIGYALAIIAIPSALLSAAVARRFAPNFAEVVGTVAPSAAKGIA